jgi:hypothetical protein
MWGRYPLPGIPGMPHGKFIQQPNHQIYMLFKETSGKKHQSAI